VKPSILFYSDFPFGYHNTEAETKMSHFAARGYGVHYVEQLGIRNPRPAHARRVLRRALADPRRADSRTVPFEVLSPKLLPPRRAPLVDALNRAWLKRQLRPALANAGSTVLWVRFPTPEVVSLAESQPFRLVVYELVDDHLAGPGMTPRLQRIYRRAEERLLRRADVAFAWSEPLREKLSTRHSNVHLAPAAVDPERFAVAAAAGEPQERVALYAGSVDFRFDTELLAATARAAPDWRFLVAGPVTNDSNRLLAAVDGVELLGRRPPGEMPALIAGAAVCLMPYRVNSYSENLFPVKLVEYLAAGRPVVSTPLRAALDLGSLVSVAEGGHAFAASIREAAGNDSAERRNERMEVAAGYSWDRRIDDMESALNAALQHG